MSSMDAESLTSNDVRKRIEQLSKSLENRIKSKQNKSKFYFTEDDDEILDSNALEFPSEPGNWLYASEQCNSAGEQSRLENHILESMSAMVSEDVSSVVNQSGRSYDSRTYTRPKKQPLPSRSFVTSQDSTFRMDGTRTSQDTFRADCTRSGSPYMPGPFGGPHLSHLNFSTDDNTMESSLGIIDINNLTESQQLDFEKASMERRQSTSSTPPQSLEALNVTYEKNNSTLCIASDGPLNSTFTLEEGPEISPPTRQNSKFAKNCLPEPSFNSKLPKNQVTDFSTGLKTTRSLLDKTDNNSTFDKHQIIDPSSTPQNSKFYSTQLPDPSTVTQNSKLYSTHLPDPSLNSKSVRNETSSITLNSRFARSQSPEASNFGLKFARNHSPEPSPLYQNSKFSKKPLSESTPLVKNSRFTKKFTTNHDELEEEMEVNGGGFSSTSLNKDNDDIMNISYPSMMQSSTSLQGDLENTFDINPNATIDKKKSTFVGDIDINPNATIDKKRSSFGAENTIDLNPNATIDKKRSSFGTENTIDMNPNATIDKKRSSFGAGRFKTSIDSCEDVDPNLTIDKRRGSEVNPNSTIDKRRVSLGGNGESDPNTPVESRGNFEVNPNLTVEKRRISLGQGRYSTSTQNSEEFEGNPIEKISDYEVNTTIGRRKSSGLGLVRSSENLDKFGKVVHNTTVERTNTIIEKANNSEINPYLTIDKRKSTIAQQLKSSSTENILENKSSSTDNVIVNNLNAKYQECLKNSERIQALRDCLGGDVPSKNLSQVTPPHADDFLGEPVSFSTPSRGAILQKSSPKFTNGCSEDSSTEISPVSMEDCVSPRASSEPPLDGTFCKNDSCSKKDGTFCANDPCSKKDSCSKNVGKLLDGGASPLNSTFRKQALSSTFCKSAETLNNGGGVGGSVESGPEEDGMSTASDSSFSSSSTHMRSVGEIQSIARLQEESLSLQNNTALRKIAWGGSDSGDGDLSRGNQTAFRKQTMSDDGNQSDQSERCSPSSERCSPTALNNNLRNVSRLSLKPLSSYSRTGGLSMQHARSVEQLPSSMSLARTKQSTFGLKRPTVVGSKTSLLNNTTLQQPPPAASQPPPPAAMAPPSSRLPTAAAPKASGLRPPTAIPRPVSRLPAPKVKTGLPRYNGKSSGQS